MNDIVTIQFTEDEPKYRQIADFIEAEIEERVLSSGVRLPAIRRLSRELGVNPVTVVKAYDLLEKRSLVVKRAGSGVYVETQEHKRTLELPLSNSDELYLDRDIAMMRGGSIRMDEPMINFATSTPDSDLFPVSSLKEALNYVIDRDGGRAFEYDESMGYLPLRQTLSLLLAERYQITAEAESIHIISGAQQGIDIIAKALLGPGETVLTEDPTYAGALAVFTSRGARIVGIPMQADGPDLAVLEQSLETYRPKLIYLMPDFQNPTGITCSLEKRREIITLAERFGSYIIEDDYLSDLRYSDKESHVPLKALDSRQQRVIYLKSFSKLMMPGLRIGFIAAPEAVSSAVLKAKHMTDISSSGLIQRTFDAYLRQRRWDEHLKNIRDLYAQRFERLLTSCEEQFSELGVTWTDPKGGLSLWLRLPNQISSLDVYKRAAEKGVLITPGEVFRSGLSRHDDHFRISIAAAGTQDIIIGVTMLGEVITSLLQHRRGAPARYPMM